MILFGGEGSSFDCLLEEGNSVDSYSVIDSLRISC